MKLKKQISLNLQNILGWHSKTRILVIESDDWGSIRMPSKKAYNNLIKHGIPVDKCPYNSNDSLETIEDLNVLFDLFSNIKDANGNPLKVTANTIMGNPDFNKIKESEFTDFFFEDFVSTYKRINGDDKVFNIMKQGISSGLFMPQLHGREHLHINSWLEALRKKDKETRLAFDNEVYGHPSRYFKKSKMSFLSALHARNEDDQKLINRSIIEASKIFEKYFGYKSESFIAARYIWNDSAEYELKKIGVKYIQGKIVQQIPFGDNLKSKIHLFGSKNNNQQVYINRNVFFEPTQNPTFHWQQDALKRIDLAFKWGKPAVVSMHRLNFMGGLNEKNRTKNLILLKELINKIQQKYPEVIFMSTNELGKIINNDY